MTRKEATELKHQYKVLSETRARMIRCNHDVKHLGEEMNKLLVQLEKGAIFVCDKCDSFGCDNCAGKGWLHMGPPTEDDEEDFSDLEVEGMLTPEVERELQSKIERVRREVEVELHPEDEEPARLEELMNKWVSAERKYALMNGFVAGMIVGAGLIVLLIGVRW